MHRGTYRGIVNDLHRPTEFRDEVEVRQRSHVTMGPGMDGDVRLELLERSGKQVRVHLDIVANHEMRRRGLGLF